ncbi:hypothetical protein Nepgr_032918 [Nepenthes gracilis]|uniref:Phospho-N-acetylmuramoyl-pentapeptide-transferase n=1 Tax=Nepenthes gracilis TaxID=150966 RepID=A0AAD3TK88_NEPGR|nr:hypothetical protein Nepgr_032918 [Nepenthes gracilis]
MKSVDLPLLQRVGFACPLLSTLEVRHLPTPALKCFQSLLLRRPLHLHPLHLHFVIMRSCVSNVGLSHHLGVLRSRRHFYFTTRMLKVDFYRCCRLKLQESKIQKYGCSLRHKQLRPRSMDEFSLDISPLDDWGNTEASPMISSSGEDSDGEILVTPINDVDMPTIKQEFVNSEDALTATARQLAILGRRHKKYRIRCEVFINLGLMTFLTLFLALVDWFAWRIVRLPLEPFHFLCPFLVSTILVAGAGYVSVPLLKKFNIRRRVREGFPKQYFKKGTPTMGGLFFVPLGAVVAKVLAGFSPIEVSGVVATTLAFATVGLLDDTISLTKNHNFGLSGWTRHLLEVAVAAWFSAWLDTTNISSPYGMKMLVPLPSPFGLLYLGKLYLLLSSLCLVSMVNGMSSIDGLDGLAGGTAALAFLGMAIAVLPICPDLSIFGASMAGACTGLLLHNGYKASILMGNTGSLAVGGALAAMASCTGMFLPLFIASGVLVLELLSAAMQVFYFKVAKRSLRGRHRLFRRVPLHYYLQLSWLKPPFIVAGWYAISSLLALLAGKKKPTTFGFLTLAEPKKRMDEREGKVSGGSGGGSVNQLLQQPEHYQYGTFQGVGYYNPSPSHPVVGFPQPAPPYGVIPAAPYHYPHDCQIVAGYAVAEGRPVRLPRLPCCGIGIGWFLFIAGFFLAAIPWYVGALILLCVRTDYREKPGLVACVIASILVVIAITLGVTKEAQPW